MAKPSEMGASISPSKDSPTTDSPTTDSPTTDSSLTKSVALGAGMGLRPLHLHQVLRELPNISWFEVHICNYLSGGINQHLLRQIAQRYPLSFHSVSMNLGGIDPLDLSYLQNLKCLKDELQPSLISDHLCFSSLAGEFFHDLLPIPLTEHSLAHVSARVDQIQNTLDQQLLVENVSQYYQHPESEFSEVAFLNALTKATGCGILLDLNNLYVNQHNFNKPAQNFIDELDINTVKEIHLAGHSKYGDLLLDSHSSEVCPDVWQMYQEFARKNYLLPCLIEWDTNLPPLAELIAAVKHAQNIQLQASVQAHQFND